MTSEEYNVKLLQNKIKNCNHMEQLPWEAKCVSWYRNFRHFMESEDSLSSSQEPATCPYPEPYEFDLYTYILSPQFLTAVLILSSHPCLGFISDLFSSEYDFICISHVLHACDCPVHLTLRDLIALVAFRSECTFWNCPFCSLLQFRIWPSLSPYIFLSILISTPRNPCSFHNVIGQVS
jgi:hypothetical protein